jgi:S1-C subfamily serine protease
LLLLALAACGAPVRSEERIERSVVRILNHSQRSNWYTPWESGSTQQHFGSGFIIEGGLVMTNAHVVSDARMLLLYLHGDPTPHEARVASIGHDCDLALLQPVEPELLDGYPAMSFDGLPQLGSVVETYGFPTAGEQISRTRGVVSRIEANLYSHSGADSHLSVQTDAAINAGNSGGPVVQDGRVVGVAFQAAPDLENVGFFIPTEVIEHFLADVADGTYDGYPELGVSTGKLENPAARRAAGLAAGDSGIRVDLVFPGSSADGHLRAGDVLVEVDGHEIANDGSVALGDLRLDSLVLVDRRQSGQAVSFGVFRQGRRLDLPVPLEPYPPLSRYRSAYDELPRYYVYAGLVFVPLSRNAIETLADGTHTHLAYEYMSRPMAEPERFEREPVILLRRLDHSVNAEIAWYRQLVVESVNGRTIHGLSDLVEAVEGNEEEFHVFEFAYFGRFGVMRREDADRAHAEILERYGVSEDRRL